MGKPLQALDEIQQFLISQHIDYIVIGGKGGVDLGQINAAAGLEIRPVDAHAQQPQSQHHRLAHGQDW